MSSFELCNLSSHLICQDSAALGLGSVLFKQFVVGKGRPTKLKPMHGCGREGFNTCMHYVPATVP